MVPSLVSFGLLAAVALSATAGLPDGPMPGIALGSPVLLLAERTLALFSVWLILVVIVIQSFRGRLPAEVSTRGVRYADADDVRSKLGPVDEALDHVMTEQRWLRGVVADLRAAEDDRRRRKGAIDG